MGVEQGTTSPNAHLRRRGSNVGKKFDIYYLNGLLKVYQVFRLDISKRQEMKKSDYVFLSLLK